MIFLGEVDDIAMRSTAEAMEPLIIKDIKTWIFIRVKRT
jgi:hypothetical protein